MAMLKPGKIWTDHKKGEHMMILPGHPEIEVGDRREVEGLGLCEVIVVNPNGKICVRRVAARDVSNVSVGVLLDESGSMLVSREATIASYNEYIETLRAKATGAIYRVTLMTFNAASGVKEHYVDRVLSEVPRLTPDDYMPNAGTPLYDSVATMIHRIEQRSGDYAPAPQVLIFVISDGQENASIEFPPHRPDKLKAMITGKQALGWSFAFLGCDLSSMQTQHYAASMGIGPANTMSYGRGQQDVSMKRFSQATANYVSTRGVSGADLFETGATSTMTLDEIEASDKAKQQATEQGKAGV